MLFDSSLIPQKIPIVPKEERDYTVQKDITHELSWHATPNEQILIETISGKIITLNVEPGETIRDVKLDINDKEGISLENQLLMMLGKQLEDSHTLDEYDIRGGSPLKLLLRSNT
ncbi:unnamed protein product [Phaedon cochleariae]|uniref:Ubiquitin-like domain-containing protein n=1 Tax=Phaedon cochleariae TaxID=80249 RepID=A0A9N9SCH4_PHACE|nr:unnamed protein product [Phaedon cochleariae]